MDVGMHVDVVVKEEVVSSSPAYGECQARQGREEGRCDAGASSRLAQAVSAPNLGLVVHGTLVARRTEAHVSLCHYIMQCLCGRLLPRPLRLSGTTKRQSARASLAAAPPRLPSPSLPLCRLLFLSSLRV